MRTLLPILWRSTEFGEFRTSCLRRTAPVTCTGVALSPLTARFSGLSCGPFSDCGSPGPFPAAGCCGAVVFQLLDVLAEDRHLRTCPQVHSRCSFLGMISSLRSSDLCDSVGPVCTVLRSSGFLKLGPHGAFGSGPARGAGFPFSARRCVVPVFRRPSRLASWGPAC